jgi:hypothetical protein
METIKVSTFFYLCLGSYTPAKINAIFWLRVFTRQKAQFVPAFGIVAEVKK